MIIFVHVNIVLGALECAHIWCLDAASVARHIHGCLLQKQHNVKQQCSNSVRFFVFFRLCFVVAICQVSAVQLCTFVGRGCRPDLRCIQAVIHGMACLRQCYVQWICRRGHAFQAQRALGRRSLCWRSNLGQWGGAATVSMPRSLNMPCGRDMMFFLDLPS